MAIHLPARVAWRLAAAAAAGFFALALIFPTERTIGRIFEADGQLEIATEYYEAWNRRYPNDFESRWHTAELLLQTADPERARAALDAMARDWPDDPRILARLVEVEDSQLRVDRVIPRLEALAAARPQDPRVLRRLADHYRWFGMDEELILALRRLITLGDSPDERTELIDILLAKRRYDDIIAIFSRDIDKMPNPVDAHLALVQAFVRTGRVDEAIAELEILIQLEPGRLEHLRELADQLVAQDRFDEAIGLYRARIDADPRNPALNGELADLYETAIDRMMASGQRTEALLLFRKRIAIEPTDVSLRLAFADMHGKNTHRVAIAELEELLRLAPRKVAGWSALGERRSWAHDLPGAIAAYQRALALAPDDAEARRALAQHLLWTHREADAMAQYRLLVDGPGNATDRAALVEILLDRELGKEALAYARGLRSAGASLRQRRLFGLAAGAADECALALPALQYATRHNRDDVEAWYTLGQCATRLDKPEEALEALRHSQRIRRGRRVGERGETRSQP
jgi:tetratricopeptide (TPR) repeat protein